MYKKKPVSKKGSRNLFKSTASRPHPMNRPRIARGGFRL